MRAALSSRRAILGAAMAATAAPAAAAAPVDPRAEVDRATHALADAMARLHGEPFVLTVDHKSAFVLAIPKGGRA